MKKTLPIITLLCYLVAVAGCIAHIICKVIPSTGSIILFIAYVAAVLALMGVSTAVTVKTLRKINDNSKATPDQSAETETAMPEIEVKEESAEAEIEEATTEVPEEAIPTEIAAEETVEGQIEETADTSEEVADTVDAINGEAEADTTDEIEAVTNDKAEDDAFSGHNSRGDAGSVIAAATSAVVGAAVGVAGAAAGAAGAAVGTASAVVDGAADVVGATANAASTATNVIGGADSTADAVVGASSSAAIIASFKEARLKKTYISKIIQSPDETKEYYSTVKNAFLSYKKVTSLVSIDQERIRRGRTTIGIIQIRGKTLLVYLPLDPAQFENTMYVGENLSGTVKYADVPFLYRVNGPRKAARAAKLIDMVAEKFGLEATSKRANEDYSKIFPYESTEDLISKGLIIDKEKEAARKAAEKSDSENN